MRNTGKLIVTKNKIIFKFIFFNFYSIFFTFGFYKEMFESECFVEPDVYSVT